MASRNGRQTNVFDGYNTDEHAQPNNPKVYKTDKIRPRRSFDMTSLRHYTTNKNKFGYISEPDRDECKQYIIGGGIPNRNEAFSSSEVSDFLAQIKYKNKTKNTHLLQLHQSVVTDHFIQTSHKNKKNHPTQINYIGIGHDSDLSTDSEVFAIKKNESFSCIKNIGLTLERFKKTLEKQPQRLHLTFHGEYDPNKNISTVKFDCIPTLPQLLTSNKQFLFKNRTQKYYRDYIAAIARIFEEELMAFIAQPHDAQTHEPLAARYTCISTTGIFDKRPKLRQLLQNIAERRFQCPCVHYRNRKFIAIWYGKWIQNASQSSVMIQAPNRYLLDEYSLASRCSNRQIDAIVRLIEKRYERIAAKNPTLIHPHALNKEYQLYSWSIMNHAINQVIPKQVWLWLNSADSNQNIDDIKADNGLYDAFESTFELAISPLYADKKSGGSASKTKLRGKQTGAQQKILEQRIRSILEEVIKNIRQDEIASNGVEYISPWLPAPLLNFKILRFSNTAASTCVRTKVVAKIQRKYKGKYDIRFNKLSCASIPAYCLCGFVPINDQKSYVLDVQNGQDDISNIIREALVSREQCKIKLLLLLGCHSYKLAQIFAPFIECIVCVHPQTEIDDNICVKFSEYFYHALAENDSDCKGKNKFKYTVMAAFENAMNKLRKSYGPNTACRFHQNNLHGTYENVHLHVDKSKHILMVVRIDRDKHNELLRYVDQRLQSMSDAKKNEFGSSWLSNSRNLFECDAEMTELDNTLQHKHSSRSGHVGQSINSDYTEIYDANTNRKSSSVSLIALQQSLDPTVDDCPLEAAAAASDVLWEYIQAKGSSHFSYSIVKCNTAQIKRRVEAILKDKKQQETLAINRKLKKFHNSNAKNKTNKATFLTETEEDLNYVDLRWDVRDLPKCECRMGIPHRIEDELILLINGKHIDRSIKLPNNVPYLHQRAASMPDSMSVPMGGYNDNVNMDANIDVNDESCGDYKQCKISDMNTNSKVHRKINKFDDDDGYGGGGDYIVKKSYDASPLYRAKYNIKIESGFSKEIVAMIGEDIYEEEMYGYIDKMTGIQYDNDVLVNDGKMRIINYNFHDKQTNQELYCICIAMCHETVNDNKCAGYKWKMINKLYTKNEIAAVYKINVDILPKCAFTDFLHMHENEDMIRDKLQNVKEMRKIIHATKWHKIPVYNRNYNKKRLILCLTKPEFIKNFIKYNNQKEINLIPIVMFDTKNNNKYIEYVWIITIDNGTHIGISFVYAGNKKKNNIIVSGIHLDKKYICAQHQLISTKKLGILDAFVSNITHLQIGNPDDDMNRIKDLKKQIFELKKINKFHDISMNTSSQFFDKQIK